MAVASVIETAKANGLNPKDYINLLLEKRPHQNMTDAELEAFAPGAKL